MKIIPGFDRIDPHQYDEFLKRASENGVFQTLAMSTAFASDHHYKPDILIVEDKGRITGALSWAIRLEYRGRLGSLTARSIVLGGPIIPDRDPRILSFLLESYLEQVRRAAVYSEFRNLFDLSWAWPEFARLGFKKERHMNYLIDLNKSEEELLKSMYQSRRKMLRRVIRKGELSVQEVDTEEGIEQFFLLVELTYKKVKKPYPDLDHFLSAKRTMKDSAVCFLCLRGEVPVASRFLFCHKDLIYDWYAGSDPEYNQDNPNEFIVWEILKWAKARGYEVFDFGGGGNPEKPYGPREFKRRFGGDEVYFDRYTLVHKPLLMKIAQLGFYLKQKSSLL